jgi:hypothetical protein
VALLMQVDLDARIPPELYVAVAELLAWLYSLEQGSQTGMPVKTAPQQPGPSGRGQASNQDAGGIAADLVGTAAEEVALHLLRQILAGPGIHQVEAVLVDQHGLVFDPLLPAFLRDVLEDLLAELAGKGRKSRPSASRPSFTQLTIRAIYHL